MGDFVSKRFYFFSKNRSDIRGAGENDFAFFHWAKLKQFFEAFPFNFDFLYIRNPI
jgi:hypothetical protein